ncbi:hypothetical protein AMJ57_03565 [Parcubacteria bacterium SG8_24]|nr:MAG: hypothetical protein AMJ57_03565 [Parcubacteria bacterium SG8_24]
MTLTVDLNDLEYSIGFGVGGGRRRYVIRPERGAFRLLSRVLGWRMLRRIRTADRIAVAVYGSREGSGGASWSTVRQAVALANTLGFCWNAPVSGIPMTGQEDARERERRLLRRDAEEAGRWAYPAYSGEPNITRAKDVP